MKSKTAAFILKTLGWSWDNSLPPEDKFLVLGVPHTCLMDMPLAFLFDKALGGSMRIMVKERFFKIPGLRWALHKMSALPLREDNRCGIIDQMVEAYEKYDRISFGIAPEGTRKPIKRWPRGLHAIATKAGVPLYVGGIDWKRKYITYGERIELTEDSHKDLFNVQMYYYLHRDSYIGRHPERFTFMDEVYEKGREIEEAAREKNCDHTED